MGNLYLELASQSFRHDTYGGLNKKRKAKRRVTFLGTFDEFTIQTVLEHYDLIAANLKVYPEVMVYDYTHHLDGNFAGFYKEQDHIIELKDDYYLISTLAHEMRHAFQVVYFPERYRMSEYTTAREYLACEIEVDAREYALAYCEAHGLTEEHRILVAEEQKIQAVIKGALSPEIVNVSDDYFRANPRINTYEATHYTQPEVQSSEQKVVYAYDEDGELVYYDTVETKSPRKIRRIIESIGVIVIGVAYFSGIFTDDEDNKELPAATESIEKSYYIIDYSAEKFLTSIDLEQMDLELLRLARNEIYARHGFIFGAKDLQVYFEKQPWYEPNPNYSDELLSQVEHANIAQILRYENQN